MDTSRRHHSQDGRKQHQHRSKHKKHKEKHKLKSPKSEDGSCNARSSSRHLSSKSDRLQTSRGDISGHWRHSDGSSDSVHYEEHKDGNRTGKYLFDVKSRTSHSNSHKRSSNVQHRSGDKKDQDQYKKESSICDQKSTSSHYSTSDILQDKHHSHKYYTEVREKRKLQVASHNKEQSEQSSSSSSEDEERRDSRSRHDEGPGPDYDFNWEEYKPELNRIFFREEDLIRRGSQEYDDFWTFVKKYLNFKRKKGTKPAGSEHVASSSGLGLPRHYDQRYRINISLPGRLTDRIQRRPWQQKGNKEELSEERLTQFKMIYLHYLDFLQKNKFAKLQKIRRDQQNLPIWQYKDQIVEAVKQYQVVVVAGDTGCGKSTQVPQYLLQAGFTNISCTQPRRIACLSLAKRVAYETLNEYGSEVAYQVRFEKSRTRATRILFLTEGLLLRQMQTDPLLHQYSVIVIDEVHERHIHTDFLLGVLKCLLSQREDLKLVLMSATINIQLFSGYFDQAPVMKVPGRLHPIQLQYIPVKADEQTGKSERLDPSPYLRVLQSIDHKYPASERGDVLMFLSGMSEIMSVVEAAKMFAQKTNRWIILPLHSALSVAEQEKVFDYPPEGVRKCIVSTNIAETSVTIDGVRFVVDSGKVKEMSYDSKYKMQKLQEFWISRASAEQRKGRSGRTGPGVCFRLYAESDYDSLQEYSTPEIQRVPLDSLILQMISMGLPNTRKFPFIEPPDASSIESSISYLQEQSALAPDETLTPIGEMLSQLPVDVVIGKMLIMASIFEMVDPVLSIAAALSVQSPFTTKAHRDVDAMNARKPLESDHGDPITLLYAFDEWVQVKAERRDSRKWCRRRGLEEQRFYEMSKLKRQFKELLRDHGLLEPVGDLSAEPVTAVERKERYASKKRLRELRHQHNRQAKKRKILKMDDQDWEVVHDFSDDDNAPDTETSIKDLEFRLSQDLGQMQDSSNQSRSFTAREMNLLKIILCSGLYPQVALADDHNSFKADSEQAFHTKTKGYVLLHPTSIFAYKPEVLQLRDIDVLENPGGDQLRGALSSKHQLLAFISLLETTKPYIVGSLRVPAMQTLLLFAASLDTNTDCTRIVCDSWLEVCIQKPEEAEMILSSVVQLRSRWQHLIHLKLQVTGGQQDIDKDLIGRKARRLQKLLSKKLTEFLSTDVAYTIRRILAAEVGHLFVGPLKEESTAVHETLKGLVEAGGEPHPIKGGIQVTPYVTFNCLQEDASGWGDYTTYLQRHWTCPVCAESMVVTVAQRLQHEQLCQNKHLDELQANEEKIAKYDALSSLRKHYHCSKCKQDLQLTTKEILVHRKSCQTKD